MKYREKIVEVEGCPEIGDVLEKRASISGCNGPIFEKEGNTGGKEGGYPCGGRFKDPEMVVVDSHTRFFEERFEMQPIIRFSMLRSRERSTLAAFRSQKRFPPFFLKIALKANKRFFFFLSFLSSFLFAR